MQQFFKKEAAQIRANHSARTIAWILIASLAWLFLWFVPWSSWLATNLWLRLGIALAIFIAPGAGLYLLVNSGESFGRPFAALQRAKDFSLPLEMTTPRESRHFLSYITSGFVLSHLMIALLGLTGRIFQFPFAYVKHTFMALGLVFIAINFLRNSANKANFISPRAWIAHYSSYWPLAILTGLTMLMTIQRVVTSDDLAYLAHLTNWQTMPNLNFSDLYFGADKIESARFWIMSTPFSQAFLADTGNMPGLILLSGYYEPFLALIAMICFYDLARTLGLSHHPAMASVALQVAFMAMLSDYLHPGAPFFHQLSTDKATAAFILTPVFIANAVELLKDFSLSLEMTTQTLEMTTYRGFRYFLRGLKQSTAINFLLSGLSLSFMHPIISAFAVFIVGTISLLGINRDNFKKHSIVILLAITILLPLVGVRLIDHEAQPNIPTDINSIEQSRGFEGLIARVGNTQFYGFNPAVLEMRIPYQERLPFPARLISWIWIIVPILVVFVSLKGVRNNTLNQHLLATTLLVALAGIPYTGWLLGYFVSAWMLERTTWLYPFGISLIFLLLAFREQTGLGKYLNSWRLRIHKKLQFGFAALGQASIWAVSIALLLLVMREQGFPDMARLQSSTRRYQELVLVGQHIDKNTPDPVRMIGSDELNDFIPALSWKAKAISYRPEDAAYPYFFTEEEKIERWSDRQTMLTREIPPEERMKIVQKYDIRYILIESYRFGWLKDLVSTYPENFKTFTFGRYSLVEIIDQ
jgi:hypothetical protein